MTRITHRHTSRQTLTAVTSAGFRVPTEFGPRLLLRYNERVTDIDDRTIIVKPSATHYTQKTHETVWLEVIRGERMGERFPIQRGQTISIGRAADCKVRLKDSKISRQHALITFQDGEYQLKDLGSSNGTLVNEIRVVAFVLHDGDLIQTGDNVFRFRLLKTVSAR